jgi:hypothetical protein
VTPVVVTMIVVVAVALLALGYAAFPHRGEQVPGAGWLGDVLERAADAVPVVSDGDLDPSGDRMTEAAPPRLRSSVEVTDDELLAELTGEPTRERRPETRASR